MTNQQLFDYLLRIGDNTLILGQRLGEWCGHGPAIEEDIALTNTALDYLGQTTNAFKHAAELENKGRDEDQIAFEQPRVRDRQPRFPVPARYWRTRSAERSVAVRTQSG